MKIKIMAALLICLALFAPACSGDGKKPSNQLILGVMPSMDYLPLAVALRENYFETLGLDLKIVKFYSANERDAAFQSGSVDGVVIDYTGAVLQKNGGVDLAITSRCDAPFYIVAGPGRDVVFFHEMEGYSVAVSQNTVIDYLMDMALKSEGVSPSAVKKVEINKIPVRFEMLMGGKIDLTGLPDPLATLAVAGGANIIGSNANLGLSITGIMFSSEAMAKKGKLIEKMYEGYNHGVDYLAEHGPRDVEDILVNDMGFKPEIIPQTALPRYERATVPPSEDIERVAGWLDERGLLKPGFDATGLINGNFLP